MVQLQKVHETPLSLSLPHRSPFPLPESNQYCQFLYVLQNTHLFTNRLCIYVPPFTQTIAIYTHCSVLLPHLVYIGELCSFVRRELRGRFWF